LQLVYDIVRKVHFEETVVVVFLYVYVSG